MSGLNIRSFAKAEPSGDMPDLVSNQANGSRQQQAHNDSDDSDEGIEYLAPDETPRGKYNLDIFLLINVTSIL